MNENDSEKVEKLDISVMMSHKNTRSYLYGYLAHTCKVFSDTFTPDPIDNAHSCGMRSAGVSMMNELKQESPHDFKLMIDENHYEYTER